jgi:hypothetical protein
MLAIGTFEEEKTNKNMVRVLRHGQGAKGGRKISRSAKVEAV